MTHTDLTIRDARPADDAALRRLAALDNRAVPDGRLLVAEVEGEIWAAAAIAGGAPIADPFRATAPFADLLELRAAQLRPHDKRMKWRRPSRSGIGRAGAADAMPRRPVFA
jgi:hypothetical protein